MRLTYAAPPSNDCWMLLEVCRTCADERVSFFRSTVSAFAQLENLPPYCRKAATAGGLLVEKDVALVAAPHTTHRRV
jgi:hypothetical protein